MTTQEMIDELSASLGNRTDLTNARMVTWLNWALYDLCGMHRRRAFRPKRFRILEGTTTFSTSVVTGTVAAGANTTFTLAAGDINASDDYYNDWVVELTAYSGTAPSGLLNQIRLITDYDGATGVCTVPTWDTNPDTSTTYSLYKRTYSILDDIGLDPSDNLWAVQRIEEAVDGNKVEHKKWTESINTKLTDTGDPGSFFRRGDDIIFDKTPDTATVYRLYYYRFPTALSVDSLATECELPEYWHEIVVLGALWRGFEKLMEPDRANSAHQLYMQEATNREDAFGIEGKHRYKGLRMKWD